MEGAVHRRLKVLAAAYLRSEGFPVVGLEVTGPIGRHRVDVAAWSDRHAPDREPLTVVIECKASRTDFVRDRRNAGRLRRERERVEEVARQLEAERLPRREPDLQVGAPTLFPELGEWDFGRSQDPEYRACLRRRRRLDEMIHGETKFFLFERYRLADRLFVAAPAGTLRARDLPPGWGLLEASPAALRPDHPVAGTDLFGQGPLSVRVRAPARRRAAVRFRERLLRNLAVANTREALRPHGVGGPISPAGESGRRRADGAPGAAWDPAADAWAPVEGRAGRSRTDAIVR
jgi:hypothetical protein